MTAKHTLPDINRLSIVSAAIMLAFALTKVVSFPAQVVSFSIFGILLAFPFNFSTVITIFTAVLAVAGMDWLIQSHPQKEQHTPVLSYSRHWVVPIFTTLVISVVLNSFASGPYWWVIYGFGSILLVAVFVAEYNVVAPEENEHPIAVVGLTGLIFALYFLLSVAVFSANLRLYIRLPLLAIGAAMAISRSLQLRLGRWFPLWVFINSLVISEIVVGFHYLPLSPVQSGLILVGIVYALTSILTGIKESRKKGDLWGEPVAMLLLMILVSLIWR
ncbi:MAG: hypothetical protein SVP52_06350 [Chloroflexota bacterium]|nr:hypothetical protein [Chloroflexota bacterium]